MGPLLECNTKNELKDRKWLKLWASALFNEGNQFPRILLPFYFYLVVIKSAAGRHFCISWGWLFDAKGTIWPSLLPQLYHNTLWKSRVVIMMPNLSSLMAPVIVIMTASSASSNGKVGIVTFLGFQFNIISMDSCKKDVTPLLTHWSYVFLALTHRFDYLWVSPFVTLTCVVFQEDGLRGDPGPPGVPGLQGLQVRLQLRIEVPDNKDHQIDTEAEVSLLSGYVAWMGQKGVWCTLGGREYWLREKWIRSWSYRYQQGRVEMNWFELNIIVMVPWIWIWLGTSL